jgi:hypothetical protein
LQKNIPKHQQEGHDNRLGGQTHSSDHCDEPEIAKGKDIFLMHTIENLRKY